MNLKSKIDQLTEELKNISDKYDELQILYKEEKIKTMHYKNIVASLTNEQNDTLTMYNQSERNRCNLSIKIQRLTEDYQSQLKDYEELNMNMIRIKNLNTDLTEKLNPLERKTHQQELEITQLKQKLEKRESECADQIMELITLKSQLSNENMKNEAYCNQLKNYEDRHTFLTEENQILSQQIDSKTSLMLDYKSVTELHFESFFSNLRTLLQHSSIHLNTNDESDVQLMKLYKYTIIPQINSLTIDYYENYCSNDLTELVSYSNIQRVNKLILKLSHLHFEKDQYLDSFILDLSLWCHNVYDSLIIEGLSMTGKHLSTLINSAHECKSVTFKDCKLSTSDFKFTSDSYNISVINLSGTGARHKSNWASNPKIFKTLISAI